ncbi:hypothetical protein [Haloplanus salilacus]|uniref:hypothetical protein n=1 Tax=Haloplanus salilacus TaxID=2949994 RepID=UPI0030D197B6
MPSTDTRSRCLCCRTPVPEGTLCAYCYPETCYDCPASDGVLDGDEWRCSHGCRYSVHEYVRKKRFTALLNYPPAKTLSYAGPRVEVIVPTGTPVRVHRTRPVDPADGWVAVVHYARSERLKERILATGIEYPPHAHDRDRASRFEGTIRENAVFAWPHDPAYTDERFDWDPDARLFLTVPERRVVVSSYRFLERVGADEYGVPVEKYDAEVTFTLDALREACRRFERPVDPSQLLI